ncbi:M28 family peptidase [Allomuricauda sp. SCSIO 65647]|uniref:M28 family peptidase n=1 Tax=Allomuricauda sp. SCSIO 65647 TaxID=2908843 RepID=UPI001F415E34|nr:M28 family peptidase [Muricauda sp. SCSIO 65647]UJH68736.1 M28 family peptidase [Muricauda sp. SCSIO 65647]
MKFSRTLSLLLLVLAVFWSYRSLMPNDRGTSTVTENSFSVNRALEHVKNISKNPHAVGFPAHETVRQYILAELKKMGLETFTQEGYTAGDWGNLSKATNILARIKGSENGKALLLLTHYDSSPHSSLGASDAGSGVATILEGARAFINTGKTPKNDIIILISDAEELGLNGADLFVHRHPWAKDVGLVLNFEARGSGGPSYMLIETNRGNGRLIKEFVAANPKYPVANSLAYSIYKMLPNDTDLTVFREDADIEGFNFAFIDDHYDYHTVLDSYERLDRTSLAHQGSYLMPLLAHFSDADLGNLKSLDDHIYFNVPFFGLVTYPFEWIWPMLALAILSFIALLIWGFKKGTLDLKSLAIGFVPLLIALLFNGLVAHFGWPALKWWYPGFQDMLHGFTYNGHTYIFVYVFLALAICFLAYHKARKISTANLLVAPILVWLIICTLASVYLKGASFFVVPVFGLLAGLWVHINQKRPNPFLLVFLALPAIFIFAPFVKMFPVGLGLKMIAASSLFVTLIFALSLPFLAELKNKMRYGLLFLLLFAVFSIAAHINSGFSEENPKPSSLLYVYDIDQESAKWATYDKQLIEWNAQFLGDGKQQVQKDQAKTLASKYSTGFTYTAPAPVKSLPNADIEITKDTVIADQRQIEVCFIPKRQVNRLDVFTNEISIKQAKVNNIELSEHYLKNRRNGKFVTHFISNNDYTEIELAIPKDSILELVFYEASNDLLDNPQFTVPVRPESSIPMPFVLNDAIMTIKTLRFE